MQLGLHSYEKKKCKHTGKKDRIFPYIFLWHIFELFSSVDWDELLQLRCICLNVLLLQGAPGGTATHWLTSSFSRQVSSIWFMQKYQSIFTFFHSRFLEECESFLCILVFHVSLFLICQTQMLPWNWAVRCDHLCQKKSTHPPHQLITLT